MKSAALRFWLLVALFAAWIAFLIYLTTTTRNPVILSRPQILASTLDIIADVGPSATDPSKPATTITVVDVLWPEDDKKLVGQRIKVTNLADCVRSANKEDVRTANETWTEPGQYILPLVKDGKDYRVATPPRSPGFQPTQWTLRIYPVWKEALRKEALRQFAEIRGLPVPE
jgi:hypothetical protein